MNRLVVVLLSALLGACATTHDTTTTAPPPAQADEQKIAQLSMAIAGLGDRVDPAEALRAAEVAVRYPRQLAQEYEITTPPLWHNTLVNLGVKPRGLCVHWTRDLMTEMHHLQLNTLKLHWGVANSEAMFRIEHSTVIVTARGDPMETGIVLDPWRDSGNLFWASVDDDTYEWVPLADVQAKRQRRKEAQLNELSASR